VLDLTATLPLAVLFFQYLIYWLRSSNTITLRVINTNHPEFIEYCLTFDIFSDDLTKIFEPLYSSKIYGVDLGLPIVKQIMEQHGGSIEIKSKKGHGTCVNLKLPIHQNLKKNK